MVGIYKITSPSGKIYIGQSIDINKRFHNYKNMHNCKSQIKLYRSLLKYGWINHKFEIIEECTIDQLNEREIYWGEFYNVLLDGLNIKGLGQNGLHSEETKQKIGQSNKGKKGIWDGQKRPEHSELMKTKSGLRYFRTDEHKNNMSNIMKNIWVEKRESIIEKIKRNKIGKKTKPIKCIENNTIYNSIKECSENMNISKGVLCSFVKGKYPYKNIKGFTFIYA